MHSGFEVFDIAGTFLPIFLIVLVSIALLTVSGGVYRWFRNSKQPVLSVYSIISSKRTMVAHHHDQNSAAHHSSTTYYVTFEVESGDRLEFRVSGEEFGQCAEGDEGKLTLQGSRYLGFKRTERMVAGAFPNYRNDRRHSNMY
ncbi:DUF2500 domain-containing protein [Paenibacillus sp. J22TS3]|uniref:DUF2500 domain-containing protein n=1 Tax=Paenibacillus sp. J22TS3 TaxID=2807192 RepID=UPI001B1BEE5B|nr:DUF2500 domain-containing protein [Paenibacillus sp. J22TS3]GIP19851.1 hypothetical protein J22TS3_01260 [Paenibacillus sp. J22TS3]